MIKRALINILGSTKEYLMIDPLYPYRDPEENNADHISDDPPTYNPVIPLDDKFLKPYFTLSISFLIWFSFFFGLFYENDGSNFNDAIDNLWIGVLKPVSPPNREIWYVFIDSWPQCTDRRNEIYRLLTVQFVHAGLWHIIANTLLLLLYGILLEKMYGFYLTCLVFQLGVLGGTLCFAVIFPYNALVGCSHGVYALLGGHITNMIVNFDSLSSAFRIAIIAIISLQIITDITGYVFLHGSNVGYSAHYSALLLGYCISSQFFPVLIQAKWKKVLKLVNLTILALYFGYILHRYISSWPPQAIFRIWTPVDSDEMYNSCCHDMFSLTNRNWPLSEASDRYECIDYKLIARSNQSNSFNF